MSKFLTPHSEITLTTSFLFISSDLSKLSSLNLIKQELKSLQHTQAVSAIEDVKKKRKSKGLLKSPFIGHQK